MKITKKENTKKPITKVAVWIETRNAMRLLAALRQTTMQQAINDAVQALLRQEQKHP